MHRRTNLIVALVVGLAALFAFANPAFADKPKYELKIASLAPKGSSWMKSFERTNREIKKATGGEVALKIYGGGVMGDEGAMVRKMRTGQLDGAAVTNVGLGDIAPSLLVLQLPLVFKNYGELDYVRDKMSPRLTKILEKNGFVLLHWGDVGFNYIFSNSPVKKPGDIKKTKMWVWDADPISKTVMEVAGVNGVMMGVPDVLPSLQTGVVDAFNNSPYGAVALQWHSKAKYVTNLKVAMVIGGLVMSKKSWEEIPEKHRKAIRKITAKNGKTLLKQIRKDNQQAIGTIKKSDIKLVQPAAINSWLSVAKKVEKQLTGEIFPASLVAEMKKHLKDYRSK
jgi:TRAP-type C4-dicarboxylate transport system substrate-binding protein